MNAPVPATTPYRGYNIHFDGDWFRFTDENGDASRVRTETLEDMKSYLDVYLDTDC